MASKRVTVPGLPIGYRFLPTEDVLIRCYLTNKSLSNTLPVNGIPDIQPSQLYSMPPNILVEDKPFMVENEWYFFVHGDEYFRGETQKEHIVGNQDGFWRSSGEEQPIIDSNRDVFAYKMCYIYCNGEKKEWRLEKYRLPYKCDDKSKGNKDKGWVMARIIEDKGYVFSD